MLSEGVYSRFTTEDTKPNQVTTGMRESRRKSRSSVS